MFSHLWRWNENLLQRGKCVGKSAATWKGWWARLMVWHTLRDGFSCLEICHSLQMPFQMPSLFCGSNFRRIPARRRICTSAPMLFFIFGKSVSQFRCDIPMPSFFGGIAILRWFQIIMLLCIKGWKVWLCVNIIFSEWYLQLNNSFLNVPVLRSF